MKLAIIGSRVINVKNIGAYLPSGVTEIVSGGARGVDRAAAEYAVSRGIPLTEFLPDYPRYKRVAPLKRNESIAQYADEAIAFWDGSSKGTEHTIRLFKRLNKPVRIITVSVDT